MAATDLVSERVTVEGGLGVLDLRGDARDTILYVHGQPTAMHWNDNEGSIGQYLLRAEVPRSFEAEKKSLRWVADGHILAGVPLSAQIDPLLTLFADGDYRLCFGPLLASLDIIPYDGPSLSPLERFYPWNSLLETRPRSTLSPDRVRHWEAAIGRGTRPIVFVAGLAGEHDVRFVIDGHHKLRAYDSSGIEPPYLVIERLAPPPTTEEEGAMVLARARVDDRAYRRQKRT